MNANLDRFAAPDEVFVQLTAPPRIPECDCCGNWLIRNKYRYEDKDLCRQCADDAAGIERERLDV
jgi:formylmethanofuran dehydrogenase subunit E